MVGLWARRSPHGPQDREEKGRAGARAREQTAVLTTGRTCGPGGGGVQGEGLPHRDRG